jgi:2-(1,2-epoxy-1,2-dihydrophenyl)acetyl-CoA isomerase
MAPSEHVLVEARGAVTWITLARPEVKNAISADMREALLEAFEAVGADASVRAVVLTGTGDAFCTGADISRAATDGPQADVSVREMIKAGVQRLFRAVHGCEVPTIAAVNGTAAGFGVHLALACDLVVAADTARFIEVFAKRGIVPDGGGAYLLPRLVGVARAKELVFFGDPLGAADAERFGVINRSVPAAELEAFATGWAERLSAGPTRALALTKALLNRSLESDLATALDDEAAAQEAAVATEDMREGMRAFAERRDPQFRGR